MSEYTPGPWNNIIHGDRDSRVGAKTLIAIVYSQAFKDRKNQEANARLISQAPDMLELLKQLDSRGGLGLDVHARLRSQIDRAEEKGD